MNFKKSLAALLAGLLLGASATVTASALDPHGTGIKMRGWLTNNPGYQFSEAYKTSVWYENFTALELSANDRNNVLRIAISQLGYHEGNSSADFHGRNTSGTGNYIEYARLLTPNLNDNSYDWCACFVNWCLNQAHFDKASSEIGCQNWINELKSMSMWKASTAYGGSYTPKPADLIFFDWDKNNQWSDHIGLVLYTTDSHVYTIEGNTKTDNVAVRSYALTDPQVMGYGTPPYNEGGEATIDHSYAAGMPCGTYIVNSATAKLTDRFGENPSDSVPLGSSVSLIEVKDDYALVAYQGKRGYLPTDCLYLMSEKVLLTYDANGGHTPPSAEQVSRGLSVSVTDEVPVLEGDTFLGWSLLPYNVKVDFRPGDSLSLTKDTTLYAVWEDRSQDLAKQAAAEGYVPAYERPDTIQNSAAILLGTLKNIDMFTDCGDTAVMLIDDSDSDKVLAFASTAQSEDPYVTLPYGDLCRSLGLAPVTGEEVAYVILRVKDVSMSNVSVELSFNGQGHTPANLMSVQSNWQYLVFDLSSGGFTGELDSLRIDWQRSASTGGEIMHIADIYFASSKAIKDAIVAGKYVYPVQEILDIEIETDPITTPPNEAETKPQDESQGGSNDETEAQKPPLVGNETTTAEDTVEAEESTELDPQSSGCTSILRTSAWVGAVLLACVPVIWRKKED